MSITSASTSWYSSDNGGAEGEYAILVGFRVQKASAGGSRCRAPNKDGRVRTQMRTLFLFVSVFCCIKSQSMPHAACPWPHDEHAFALFIEFITGVRLRRILDCHSKSIRKACCCCAFLLCGKQESGRYKEGSILRS